jgi:signal transduction histidine kinase
MNDAIGILGESGMKFFGAMTASISHELKNVLAIINENAGLMGDLTHMMMKSGSVDLDRLHSLAGRFGGQVSRADRIIKYLNQFAHSMDHPVKEMDLCEELQLAVDLSHRFADMKAVRLELNLPEAPICISTNSFFLLQLLWLCLEYAVDVSGPQKTVKIDCNKYPGKVNIKLSGFNHQMNGNEKDLFREQGKAVVNFLNADIKLDEETDSMTITLPESMILPEDRRL